MTEFAKSPVVNVAFDDHRRDMFGDRLMTPDRFEAVVASFAAGMKPAHIASLRRDPYFGIATRGRRGAGVRLAAQEAARPKRTAATGTTFKTDAREKRFRAALADGATRNKALRAARRVSPE